MICEHFHNPKKLKNNKNEVQCTDNNLFGIRQKKLVKEADITGFFKEFHNSNAIWFLRSEFFKNNDKNS